jgi:hypothetical protein
LTKKRKLISVSILAQLTKIKMMVIIGSLLLFTHGYRELITKQEGLPSYFCFGDSSFSPSPLRGEGRDEGDEITFPPHPDPLPPGERG